METKGFEKKPVYVLLSAAKLNGSLDLSSSKSLFQGSSIHFCVPCDYDLCQVALDGLLFLFFRKKTIIKINITYMYD